MYIAHSRTKGQCGWAGHVHSTQDSVVWQDMYIAHSRTQDSAVGQDMCIAHSRTRDSAVGQDM